MRASRMVGIVAAVGAAAWFLPQTAVNGQPPVPRGPTTTTCAGTTTASFGDPGTFGQHPDALVVSFPFDEWVTEHTVDLTTPLPAGTYQVQAVTYDGYDGRETMTQPFEQVVFQPLAADGSVLATSSPTDDIPDFVLEATVTTNLAPFTIAAPATRLRARAFYLNWDRTPNSVDIICVGFTQVGQPTTTTTTSTTTTSTTSTTSTTTTAPPGPTTSSTTTTSSTIPTEVLPEVIIPITPIPRPQVVDPTFTG